LSNEIRKGLVVDTEKEIDEAGRLLKMVKADYIIHGKSEKPQCKYAAVS